MHGRILIIGMGDLGKRIAGGLAGCAEVGELILAGREIVPGRSLAALLAACGESRVRFIELDASQLSDVERMLQRERPDVVVQCASLLSPWYLSTQQGPAAAALRAAGFAAQLPAQLPILTNVMTAVRAVNFQGPVVNCSYPDVTHNILARSNLEPTIGIGNVSMIQARVRVELRGVTRRKGTDEEVPSLPLVRVLAHHAHVTSTVLSLPPKDPALGPRVYLGERAQCADELAYAGTPLASNPSLNALSAATGLPVIRAFLAGSPSLRVSAPGPMGLPGGYPILIKDGRIELDLPEFLKFEEAVEFQRCSARMDGVESIADDGTVSFTDAAQTALRQINPALCEPLHPTETVSRFRLLMNALQE